MNSRNSFRISYSRHSKAFYKDNTIRTSPVSIEHFDYKSHNYHNTKTLRLFNVHLKSQIKSPHTRPIEKQRRIRIHSLIRKHRPRKHTLRTTSTMKRANATIVSERRVTGRKAKTATDIGRGRTLVLLSLVNLRYSRFGGRLKRMKKIRVPSKRPT